MAHNKKPDRRRSLLAKIHILVKNYGIADEDYRDIISAEYPGKTSSKELSNGQIAGLINYLESKYDSKPRHKKSGNSQVDALQEKAEEMLKQAHELGFVRHPRKLVLKILKVSDIKFCNDATKLKQLLAVLQRVE